MIVGLRFNIRISQKENRQDDDNDIPTGEDQPTDTIVSESATQKNPMDTHVKVLTTFPTSAGSYQAEKATIAGIWRRQTCSAYADPISILHETMY